KRGQQPKNDAGCDVQEKIGIASVSEQRNAFKGIAGEGRISPTDTRDKKKPPFHRHPGVSLSKPVKQTDQEAAGDIDDKRSQWEGQREMPADGNLHQVAADAAKRASKPDDDKCFHDCSLLIPILENSTLCA